MNNTFESIASVLYTPGHQPKRYAKAKAVGAHGVMLDMEDAVGEDDKVLARDTICQYLQNYQPDSTFLTSVRINPLSTALGRQDLHALKKCAIKPELLALPKVESAAEIRQASELDVPLLVMIESELALREAATILSASDLVKVIFFGGYDFAADLQAECSWESMLMIRSQLVLLARRFQCALWDVPFIDLGVDVDVDLKRACQQVKALGFSGKMAIHPDHIATINQVFMPSSDELSYAQAIVDAMAQSNGGACRVHGKMIDQPLLRAAERTLSLHLR